MQQKGARHSLVAGGGPAEAGPISNRCQRCKRETEKGGDKISASWEMGGYLRGGGRSRCSRGDGELILEDCQNRAMRLETLISDAEILVGFWVSLKNVKCDLGGYYAA